MQVKKNERGVLTHVRGNYLFLWEIIKCGQHDLTPKDQTILAKTRHRDMNNSPKNIIPGQLINKAQKCGIVVFTNLEINVKSRTQSISFHKEDNNNNRNNFISFILCQTLF